MDSPRGRIHLMDARLDGTIALNHRVTTHFDRCLGCMACVTSCPSGVRYDRLIESTRAAVEHETRGRSATASSAGCSSACSRTRGGCARRSRSRRSAARAAAAAGSVRWSRWRRPGAARGEVPSVDPAQASRAAVSGFSRLRPAVVFSDVNAATARVLAADGFEVVAPPQGCCGALSVHAGRAEEGKRSRGG